MTAESVPLALVGIGCLFPKADGPGAYWANVKHGVDCVGPVPATHWRPDEYFDADPKSPDMTYAQRGAFLDAVDFNPLEFGISPVDLEATDTSQLLGLVAARQALNDAGYTAERPFDKSRVSVILGVTGTLELVIPLGARLGHPKWRKALAAAGVDDETAERVVRDIGDSYVAWQENSFPGLLGNVVAGRIANKLDLGGTNCVVDAACASSLSAIHLAGLELAAGRCDIAVTGGVDTFNDIFMYMCFSKTPALSKSGDAKPFDADGDGTILGEGLGIIVLKRLDDAERDGDRIYAVLKAMGSSSDGKGNAVYAPSASGQVRALSSAYELARVSPATIELIEAHGTGTKVGDSVEATALSQVFRAARPDGTWCALGSVKSMVGHTKAAAGAAGLIKVALALYNKVLPPTLKVKRPVEPLEPGKSPLYLNTERRPWLPRPEHPRRAGLSAFGFGGSNFHAVLEEHRPDKATPDWDGRTQIVAFTADSPAQLVQRLDEWPKANGWGRFCQSAAESRAAFLASAKCRLLFVVQPETEFDKLMTAARQRLEREPDARFWALPGGAYFGRGPAAGSLAVLFSGQGAQTIGMLRDLACTFPEMLAALAEADGPWPAARRLSDYIYPQPAFTADVRSEQEAALRATEIAQPALGAVSLGGWRVLQRFGIAASAFAGHSYGELVALCAAGVVAPADLHAMSRERGRLMASFRDEDAGVMLAVQAAGNELAAVLRDERLDLVIANRNSPSQFVLSGTTAEIARAEAALQRRKTRSTRLPVAAGFHSPLVARAQQPFRDFLEGVPFAAAATPVYSNRTAELYPLEAGAARGLLADQLANPVEFIMLVENLARSGVRSFLEVGPGSILTRLVEATLANRDDFADWDCFALDASAGKKPGLLDLAHVLARAAARGHSVQLAAWEAGQRYAVAQAKPGLTVPITGANYVRPKPAKPDGKPPPPRRAQVAAPIVFEPSLPSPVMSQTPSKTPVETAAMSTALSVTQQSLQAFQRMQEETARLHKQFLDNQQSALNTLQLLVAQQHALLTGQTLPAVPIALPQQAIVPPTPPVAPTPPTPPTKSPSTPVPAPAQLTPQLPPARLAARDSSQTLLAVVAEKTGYPADMLGLDMALDADLGIDSIKRVEILSAIQEKIPDAPAVKPEHLGTLHTLRDIVGFLDSAAPASPMSLHSGAPPTILAPPLLPAKSTDLAGTLLAVVAEKTGYPADMLGLDMALDADLGIDSIKRVEILSAIQEKIPDAPAVKPEHLGTMHTLRDIASFLSTTGHAGSALETPRPFESALAPSGPQSERHAETTGPVDAPIPAVPSTATDRAAATPAPRPLAEAPTVALAAATVPLVRSTVRPVPIDLATPRPRVTLDKFAPVWLIAEPSSFTARLSQYFDSAGCKPQFIPWNDSAFAYDPKGLAGLVLLAPDESGPPDLALRAFRWLKRAAPALAESARRGGAFFATVTKLDGVFGFGPLEAARDPVQGALAGLSKTAAHEWPNVVCKAIDIDPNVLRHIPHVLVEEILTSGPREVGLSAKGRVTLELIETPAMLPAGDQSLLAQGDVVVVTGGARGVTAEALFPLVRQARPKLVLLGRTPPAGPEPSWLAGVAEEAALKRAIAENSGRPVSPREIGEEYKRIAAGREMARNLQRLREAGAVVEYVPVDVTDTAAVTAVFADVRVRFGPIAALIHGAGVIADRKIEDLSEEQFQSVYATKVHGLRNLLAATEDDPIKAIVLFSSSTGRFGRIGQVAYAAANEVLNKTAQRLSRAKPHCRTVAINWGPWDGGMVTPGLAKTFAKEGIGLIPTAEGAEFLRRELASADRPAEVIVLANPAVAAETPPSPHVSGDGLTPVFERRVSLNDHIFLRSHVIGDKAVVPFVLHLEWMAHAAMHGNPGLRFHGFDNLRIFQGIHADESSAAIVRVLSGRATRRDDAFFVPVEIKGLRGGKEVTHSRAEIVLAERLPDAPFASSAPETGPFPYSPDEVYEYILFHGPYLRAFERIDGMGEEGALAFVISAPPPSSWMENPVRAAWLADPLILDGAFQLLSVWSYQRHRAASLPCFVQSYRQYRRSFPADGVLVGARITRDNGTTARANIEFIDADGRLVAHMADAEHVIDQSLNEAFRRGRMVTPTGSTHATHIGSRLL